VLLHELCGVQMSDLLSVWPGLQGTVFSESLGLRESVHPYEYFGLQGPVLPLDLCELQESVLLLELVGLQGPVLPPDLWSTGVSAAVRIG